jgi:hypothetical protein
MAQEMGVSRQWYGVLERRDRPLECDHELSAQIISCGLAQGKYTRRWFGFGRMAGNDQVRFTPQGYGRRASASALDIAAEACFEHWLMICPPKPVDGMEEAKEAFRQGFALGWKLATGEV